MIEINPHALYTRDDLAAMLKPAGVDVDHFIARLKPRKVFKMLFYGADILKALETAPSLAERDELPTSVELPPPTNRGNRTRRGADEADVKYPGAKLDDFRRSLREKRQ